MTTPATELLHAVDRKLNLIALGANLAGALLTFLYFQTIDPLPVGETSVQSVPFEAWVFFVGLMTLTLAVGTVLGSRGVAPVRAWRRQLEAGADPAAVPAEVARRALNLAPYTAGISFAMWVLAATIFPLFGALFAGHPPSTSARSFVGVLGVGGVLTTAITYFSVDLIWRQAIPIFFPDGKLSSASALRLSVLGRLLIVFLLIGLWPLALLANLSLQRAHALVGAPNPETILTNLVVLELFILGVGLAAGVGMAIFVTRSIVRPLGTLQAAMARVEENDLNVQVPVATNDELGYLSERFNAMTRGLRQGELLRTLLNLYVSPEVAREIVQHGARFGGKLVECTVLFSDIRDFTGLSERLPAAELIELLNRYMSAMVAVVVGQGGMVNKFGGDSLLAVFGTPLNPAADHAARAVRAAVEMRRALDAFNRAQAAVQGPTLRIGIGLATGPVVAGNVGGKERIEYTVIGDTVNLASRLQTMTRELGVDVLMSAGTHAAAAQTMPLEVTLLPAVAVRGKQKEVAVYTLA